MVRCLTPVSPCQPSLTLLYPFVCKNSFVCALVSACMHACVRVSGLHVEIRLQLGRVSSLYHTRHRDPIQVIRLSSQYLCPLSHLTVLFCLFCFLRQSHSLKLTMSPPQITLNFLHLASTWDYRHVPPHLVSAGLVREPRPLCMLSKHSNNCATSQPHYFLFFSFPKFA